MAAIAPDETGRFQQSHDAALARRIGTGADLFVLASMDDCPPCIQIKPIVRHLSVRLSVELHIAEPPRAARFLSRYAVERFPELLLFRDGRLIERHVGYHGFDELYTFMSQALGRSGQLVETDEDCAVRALIDMAQAALDAMMAPASDALAPFMEAANASLQAHAAWLQAIESSGQITAQEMQRLRRAEQLRIYAPFQDKIDALREVQAKALRHYQETTDQIVRSQGATASSPSTAIVCGPDDSVCSVGTRR